MWIKHRCQSVCGFVQVRATKQSFWHFFVCSAFNTEAHRNLHLVETVEHHLQRLLRHGRKAMNIDVHLYIFIFSSSTINTRNQRRTRMENNNITINKLVNLPQKGSSVANEHGLGVIRGNE